MNYSSFQIRVFSHILVHEFCQLGYRQIVGCSKYSTIHKVFQKLLVET